MHFNRIFRHDKICDIISTESTKKGIVTLKEPHIPTNQGIKKPDLIFVINNEAIVTDVAIANDSVSNSLDRTYQSKVASYQNKDLHTYLKQKLKVSKVSHLPFILTARGIYHSKNDEMLEKLKCKSLREKLVTENLIQGVRIWKAFNKHVTNR